MKFTIDQELLVKTLKAVGGAISNRATIPVLSGVKVTAGDDTVELEATDLDYRVRATTAAKVQDAGVAVVPYRLFLRAAEVLANPVTIESIANGGLKVKGGEAGFEIFGLSADEFPAAPGFQEHDAVTLPGDALKTLIRRTVFSAASEEEIQSIANVLVECDAHTVRAVATNGKCLAEAVCRQGVEGGAGSKALVPQRFLRLVAGLVNGSPVRLGFNEKQVRANLDGVEVTGRLGEGVFPDYKSVHPKALAGQVEVNSARFHEALSAAALVADDANRLVKLRLSANGVGVTAESATLGRFNDLVDGDKFGGVKTASQYNVEFLLGAARVAGERAVVGMAEGEHILQLASDGFSYMAMPIRINPAPAVAD